MRHSLRILSSICLTAIIAAPHLVRAQSAAADTTKADTAKKPVFTLKTLRVQPLYVFEINDNAKINADSQFSGVRPVPSSLFGSSGTHLQNIRQLTFEGVNTRPSVSPDGRDIIFQSHGIEANSCDQIYRLPIAVGVPAGRISNGRGEAQTPAFLSDDRIVYSSTQSFYNGACPPKAFGPSDLYISDTDGKEIHRVTNTKDFNGGVFTSSNRIFFLSDRNRGRFELFSIKPDGSELHQLARESGFEEGAISPNGTHVIATKTLHHEPTIYECDADGSHERLLAHNAEEPCWTPDGRQIVFCRRAAGSPGTTELYRMNADGSNPERITTAGDFQFPTFTPDGRHIVFCSSQNASHPGDINIFVADWEP